MKAIKSVLSVAALFVVYSACWYFLADSRQKGITQWADELRKSQAIDITWQNIEKCGFPFTTSFAIKDPKVIYGPFSIQTEGSVEVPFSLTGELQGAHGQIQSIFQKGDFQKGGFQSSLTTDIDLTISGSDASSLSLNNTNLSISIDDTPIIKNLLLDTVSIHTSRSRASNAYRVQMNAEGITYTPQTVLLQKGLIGYKNYINQELSKRQKDTSSSIDCELTLPPGLPLERITELPWLFLSKSVPTCSFKLNEFKASSNLFSMAISALASISEKDNKISLSGLFDSSTDFSSSYYETLKDITKNYVATIDSHEKLDFDMLLPLIPKLQEFGTIRLKKEGLLEVNKGTWAVHASIPTIALTTDLYSIDLSLDASNIEGPGEVTFKLQVQNFRRLIEDLISYFNSFTRVYTLVRDETMPLLEPASEATKHSIVAFFERFTTDPKADIATFEVHYHNGQYTYGKYTQEEFSQIATTLLQGIWAQITPNEPLLQKPKKP